MGRAASLRERWTAELAAGGDGELAAARASLESTLRRDLPIEEAADILAQSVACASPILSASPLPAPTIHWLLEHSADWERWAIGQAATTFPPLPHSPAPSHPPAAHRYEKFLRLHHRDQRKRRGVFFTPEPVANYIVGQTHRLLQEHFELPDGLASDSALRAPHSIFPLILDPACGTGVFLLAVLRHVQQFLGDDFCSAVPGLLRRLIGVEILPAAALLAKLNVAAVLSEAGYRFRANDRVHILCGDTLSPSLQSELCNLKSAIPVVIGNPPFSSLSTNSNDWIARLVRGDGEVRGYVRAGGQQLGERKTWLHDDYVKFIRLAQWHVEEAGRGIVGFITNHGYLDNVTFRLMRHELLRVFPLIRIVDLHGNRKKEEAAPSGERDENVFGLDQGVAIGLFCRPTTPTRRVSEGALPIEYSNLWGRRTDKLEALANASHALRVSVHTPRHPDWNFTPAHSVAACPAYDADWLLTDAMPANTSAPVTARDHFVVGFTREELCSRIEPFRDLSISDDEIRRRYFTRTRSARYQQGDTRGWKMHEARRIVAADSEWQEKIVRCLYRPFDWRYLFWHRAMIDWPRTEVTRHLLSSRFKVPSSKLEQAESTLNIELGTLNFCLITRRQQLPSQPCTFFWISDGLALDGVIRSDNRGSESLFPVYLHEDDGARANFAPAFVDDVHVATRLAWQPLGRGDLRQSFGPENLLGYIYALFHAPSYRERYAAELRRGFPRLLVPRDGCTFAELSRLGRQLIELHLLRDETVLGTQYSVLSGHDGSPAQAKQDPEIAAFRAGGYQVLRKWLQPPHRSSRDPEYGRIAAAVGRTIQITREIDRALQGTHRRLHAPA